MISTSQTALFSIMTQLSSNWRRGTYANSLLLLFKLLSRNPIALQCVGLTAINGPGFFTGQKPMVRMWHQFPWLLSSSPRCYSSSRIYLVALLVYLLPLDGKILILISSLKILPSRYDVYLASSTSFHPGIEYVPGTCAPYDSHLWAYGYHGPPAPILEDGFFGCSYFS